MPRFSITETGIVLCWPRDARHAVLTRVEISTHGKSVHSKLCYPSTEFQHNCVSWSIKEISNKTIINNLYEGEARFQFRLFASRE